MSWDVELANEFKNRSNKDVIGPLIGKVISINPLKISILSDKVILTEKHCYLCRRFIEINIELGDKVLCIPTSDNQKYFILDKVV